LIDYANFGEELEEGRKNSLDLEEFKLMRRWLELFNCWATNELMKWGENK
jgi:hypothetical protein